MNKFYRLLLCLGLLTAAAAGLPMTTQASISPWIVITDCPNLLVGYALLSEPYSAEVPPTVPQLQFSLHGPAGFCSLATCPHGSDGGLFRLPVGQNGRYTISLEAVYVDPVENIGSIVALDSISVDVNCDVEVVGFNCPVQYPVLSMALVSKAQPALWAPGKDTVVLADGRPLVLPVDADMSGADEYQVIDRTTFNGELWLGLHVGGCTPVWIPAERAVLLRPLP